MEITSLNITTIKTIVGTVFPPVKAKYFNQPKLYFILNYSGGSRSPGPISPNNNFEKNEYGNLFVDAMSAKRLDKLMWRYKLIIRNNSEYTAYHLKLLSPIVNIHTELDPKIDYLKPLLPNSEISHTITFFDTIVGQEKKHIMRVDSRLRAS